MKINIICDYQKRAEYRRFKLQEPLLYLSSDARFGNAYFNPDNVSQILGQQLDSVSLDLCEIATYVYLADKALSRGQYDNWTRNLSFLVPVRNPKRWDSAKSALTNAVSMLSGDNIEFHFVQKRDGNVVREHSPDAGLPGLSDCVCLFSGGLDSFAGAVYLIKEGHRPLFASHYVSGLKNLQRKLLIAIENEFGRSFEHLQYRVTSRKTKHTRFPVKQKESSHRARSFLFLSFAAAAAATRGLSDIYICENGVLSLNVPISNARKGSRSTRHAHPLFLRYFNLLINSLYEREFSIQNPFQFWTKQQEAELLKDTNLYPMIKNTVTCWGYPNQTLRHKNSNHCGYCIPCIVRRVSLMSAGLSAYDDQYVLDVFNLNGHSKPAHARNIKDLIYFCQSFNNSSTTELLYRYPELIMVEVGTNNSREDKIEKIVSVYRKFAKEVLSVVG